MCHGFCTVQKCQRSSVSRGILLFNITCSLDILIKVMASWIGKDHGNGFVSVTVTLPLLLWWKWLFWPCWPFPLNITNYRAWHSSQNATIVIHFKNAIFNTINHLTLKLLETNDIHVCAIMHLLSYHLLLN